MNRKTVLDKAIPFFASKGYSIQTQTDDLIIFQTEKRELNWLLLLVLCCLGIIPAIIYYYVFAPRHVVTISISGKEEVKITVTGNTDTAKKDANEFQSIIS
ncbi:MAG: hypothetical protein QXE90_04420 [Candidatus Micrarchaeia archaeon]